MYLLNSQTKPSSPPPPSFSASYLYARELSQDRVLLSVCVQVAGPLCNCASDFATGEKKAGILAEHYYLYNI